MLAVVDTVGVADGEKPEGYELAEGIREGDELLVGLTEELGDRLGEVVGDADFEGEIEGDTEREGVLVGVTDGGTEGDTETLGDG